MTGYDRYRYNPFTDSFVEEDNNDRVVQISGLEKFDFNTGDVILLRYSYEEVDVFDMIDIFNVIKKTFPDNTVVAMPTNITLEAISQEAYEDIASHSERYCTELKTYKKALELMAAKLVGGGVNLCQYCIGEQQELCNAYNRLHNTKEECIKTIVNYYLVEAQDD